MWELLWCDLVDLVDSKTTQMNVKKVWRWNWEKEPNWNKKGKWKKKGDELEEKEEGPSMFI